jgi:hypothetical protein
VPLFLLVVIPKETCLRLCLCLCLRLRLRLRLCLRLCLRLRLCLCLVLVRGLVLPSSLPPSIVRLARPAAARSCGSSDLVATLPRSAALGPRRPPPPSSSLPPPCHVGMASSGSSSSLHVASRPSGPSPQPEPSSPALQRLLVVLHSAYPIILLIFFLAAFTCQSIYSSRNRNISDPASTQPLHYGPGGKALPARGPGRPNPRQDDVKELPRGQRLVFQWLSVVACLSFVGSAINAIVHTLVQRAEQWWCGQAMVVWPSRALLTVA